MNKAELVETVAQKIGHTKKSTDLVLEVIMASIMDAVASGDKVVLAGFGRFESSDRRARNGRNPGTGEPVVIPATKIPVFRPGKDFKVIVKAS